MVRAPAQRPRERRRGRGHGRGAARLRREAAIPLVLRSLGQDRPRDAASRCSRACINSELDGVDVRGAIVAALLASDDRDELVGALEAIGWLAPSGGFPATPAALGRVLELSEHDEEAIRILAAQALVALAR